ncbi:hypothetical protein SUSAZ_02560 [Sulfolobus acidocaldarius SUSAZ]|nr:hypothetical protein SUSAZ_02560 [Sulfolobus acidocaldarius SUSAZ]
MLNPFQLLFYSQLLASLTYFIGATIYALPVPVYGVKKWAPKLITDSIYVVVWNSIYLGVLLFLGELLSLLGVTWDGYFSWLNNILYIEQSLYLMVKTILTASNAVPEVSALIQVVPFGALLTVITSALTFTTTLIAVSKIVYQYVAVFIATGVLFLSIPFRIGRSVGGAFIGSGIVFYVGLPYLPQFLAAFQMLPTQELNTPPQNASAIIDYYVHVVPSIITSLIIGPVIYIFILVGFSMGVASLVSGYGSRLPLIIDVF